MILERNGVVIVIKLQHRFNANDKNYAYLSSIKTNRFPGKE